jgi:hypothetical protein
MGKVEREEKELLKQVGTYADGITAFSAVQSIGFVLSLGSGSGIATNVQKRVPIACFAIGLSLLVYCGLLFLCHWNENNLARQETTNSALRKAVTTIQSVRYVIVILAALLSTGVVLSTLLK